MSDHLSSADAAWLHMDRPTNLMVINSVLLFDRAGRLGARQADHADATGRPLSAVPPARGREPSAAADPAWEDDPDFALEHHMHHLALPAPGDDRSAAGARRAT